MSSRPAANRMTLQQFKGRLNGAKKGYQLLKKKRDALKARFQMLLKDIVDCKRLIGQTIAECYYAQSRAKWAMGVSGADLSQSIVQRVAKNAISLKLMPDNIAGVVIPKFELQKDAAADTVMHNLGIGQGGQVLQLCKVEFSKVLALLVRLAGLQTSFVALDHEIKITSRRVNALDYVVIPRLETTIKYIQQEMDELEREEFFRIKKVVEKKRIRMEKERMAAIMMNGHTSPRNAPVVESIIEVSADPDLVF